MDVRGIVRTALRICYDEKSTLAEGLDYNSRVYKLYEKELAAINELAERVKDDKKLARYVLEILADELTNYPVRCSLLFDRLWEHLQGIDPKLEKLILFLSRGDFYDDIGDIILSNVKLRRIFLSRLEEYVKNAMLRRIVGANLSEDELDKLKRMLKLAEKTELEKRLLERRKIVVRCLKENLSSK